MASTEVFHVGGRQLVGGLLNKSLTAPTNWYLLLRTLDGVGGHPSDASATDTLTLNLAEASGAGYTPAASPGRISVTNNNTNLPLASSGSNYTLSMLAQTFSFNSATGSPLVGVTHVSWATTADNSGTLLCSMPLGTTRNFVGAVSGGDTCTVTCTLTSTGA